MVASPRQKQTGGPGGPYRGKEPLSQVTMNQIRAYSAITNSLASFLIHDPLL
jgi:hypothetical protein